MAYVELYDKKYGHVVARIYNVENMQQNGFDITITSVKTVSTKDVDVVLYDKNKYPKQMESPKFVISAMDKSCLKTLFKIHNIVEYEYRDSYLYAKDINGSESLIPYGSYGAIMVLREKEEEEE